MSDTLEYSTVAGSWRARLLTTRAPGWSILVRLLVGLVVFLPEGIQKLIYPDMLGAGRFANIGIPYPELMGPFVGIIEIVCGALIILGLFTRLVERPAIANRRLEQRANKRNSGSEPPDMDQSNSSPKRLALMFPGSQSRRLNSNSS
jgi:hypothetical protein